MPVAAQFCEVPFVPGLKPAVDKFVSTTIPLKSNSCACVVVGVAPLDGDALVDAAKAVWSSGELASPGMAKA